MANSIPRFVSSDNYAAGFGLEWNRHAHLQYDSRSDVDLSANRFFTQTGWPRRMLGEVLIEPGSGGGRFTEQAASTGATVLSLDYSSAVDANYKLNGHNDNVLIVQGDIYQMPFPYDYADRIFCFGVLQHTPDPRGAFLSLGRHLKPGGELAADVYVKSLGRFWLQTKYLVRPFTRRMDPERLYRWVRRYVDLMWPVATLIRRVPKLGPSINWRLLIADYTNEGVTGSALKEWAYLDTFDMLAPRYDQPQTMKTVQAWLRESQLDGEAFSGMNGIAVRAIRRET
ncbi:MAG: class I SAM-dependent methyltransferase [Actinomycetota bacterium]|nr:class I SAM-dependent methyltransferase [Actinomycetota bacterium]